MRVSFLRRALQCFIKPYFFRYIFWGLPLTQCTANWLNSLYGIGAGRHSKALGGSAYTQRKRTTMLCGLLA